MTLRFLLDTNVVSAPIAKNPNRKVVRRLSEQGIYCAIASPVWHELIYGSERLPEGARKAAVTDYLESVVKPSFTILPYDEVAARWHGRERARLERLGKTPPFTDGQIAAVARQHDLTLVTSNPKHFTIFEGLDIVDWAV